MTLHWHPKENIQTYTKPQDHTLACDSHPSCRCGNLLIRQTRMDGSEDHSVVDRKCDHKWWACICSKEAGERFNSFLRKLVVFSFSNIVFMLLRLHQLQSCQKFQNTFLRISPLLMSQYVQMRDFGIPPRNGDKSKPRSGSAHVF